MSRPRYTLDELLAEAGCNGRSGLNLPAPILALLRQR